MSLTLTAVQIFLTVEKDALYCEHQYWCMVLYCKIFHFEALKRLYRFYNSCWLIQLEDLYQYRGGVDSKELRTSSRDRPTRLDRGMKVIPLDRDRLEHSSP